MCSLNRFVYGQGADVAGLGDVLRFVLSHLETRRVSLAGITRNPTEEWMTQMAPNAVDEESGYLRRHRYVLHDRDAKFCADFRKTLATGGVKCLRLPPRSPGRRPGIRCRERLGGLFRYYSRAA
jgi:hypothetical protein